MLAPDIRFRRGQSRAPSRCLRPSSRHLRSVKANAQSFCSGVVPLLKEYDPDTLRASVFIRRGGSSSKVATGILRLSPKMRFYALLLLVHGPLFFLAAKLRRASICSQLQSSVGCTVILLHVATDCRGEKAFAPATPGFMMPRANAPIAPREARPTSTNQLTGKARVEAGIPNC